MQNMKKTKTTWRTLRTLRAAFVASLVLAGTPAQADEVRVMTSGAFTAAYLEVIPEFERATGHTVISAFGASMGNAPDSIPSRLERGEPVDVVILARSALDRLVADGRVVAGSQIDLVRSAIGMAVRAGAPKPDISSVDALVRTLRQARSIAYSASASGTYLSTDLFPRLGIAEELEGKSRRIVSERVAAVVARGEAEIGFQQISELLPDPGVDYVGPLPAEVQRVTVFSAGLASGAANPEAAQTLIAFLASPGIAPTIRKTGLEPVAGLAGGTSAVPVHEEPNHTVVYADRTLRILDVNIPIGATTLNHRHEHDIATVCISASDTRSRTPGAEWSATRPRRVGETGVTEYAGQPGTHRVENLGGSLFRLIAVENLREDGWSSGPSVSSPGIVPAASARAFGIYDVRLATGRGDARHVHAAPTVTVLVSGSAEVRTGGAQTAATLARPGAWTTTPAGLPHDLTGTGGDAHLVEIEVR